MFRVSSVAREALGDTDPVLKGYEFPKIRFVSILAYYHILVNLLALIKSLILSRKNGNVYDIYEP